MKEPHEDAERPAPTPPGTDRKGERHRTGRRQAEENRENESPA
jgi:hypothetical protein